MADMTETELLRAVLRLCREHNVTWFHDTDSRRNRAGFPDLVLLGQHGICFVELKTQYGQLRREQTQWMYRLKAAGQRHYIWRPSDLTDGTIEEVLESL